MKVYIPGLPVIDTEDGHVGPAPVPVKTEVLQFTRTVEPASPLVNADTPGPPAPLHVPHSINQKPEVEI